MSAYFLSFRSEMFEPPGPQIPHPILFRNANCAGLIGYFANAIDRYAVDSFWQPVHIIRPKGEQQLEIFATMQGQHEWIKRPSAA